MADTFISYSRKDIAFAKIVNETLESSELETWIDWQDIPPSADWFAEIEEAIEQADTFIFIISPTSVESEVCSREIAHAEKNNKRLIPIVIDDIDPQCVPNTLLPLNWIFFKEEDREYAQALENLITAITLDQPWLKKHTRIQNRALEWARSEYQRGYLLHGADLEDAEVWLSQAAGKDPAPTALQTSYIVASRTAATRQQRRMLIGVAAALVVALALGVLAWTQRNAAVRAEATAVAEANSRSTQQAIAEEQTISAQSRELAALSGNLLEEELDLGILLAIESFNKSESYITRGSVMQSLQTSPQVSRIFHVETEVEENEILSLAFSPDGGLLAYGHLDGTIHFLDPLTGEEHLPAITTYGAGDIWGAGDVFDIAFSPDGALLASATRRGAQLYRVSDREELFLLDDNPKYYSVAFSTDSRLVAGLKDANENLESGLYVWDTHTGELVLEKSSLAVGFNCTVTFTPGGESVVVYDSFRGITIVDLRSGEYVLERLDLIAPRWGTGAFGIHPDGHLLAQVDFDNTIFLYDRDEERLVSEVESTQNSDITELIFSAGGRYFFTINNSSVYAWDGETGEAVGSMYSFTNSFNEVVMDPTGVFFAAGDDFGRIYLLTIYQNVNSSEPFFSYEASGGGAVYSPYDSLLAFPVEAGDEQFAITLWETETYSPVGEVPVEVVSDIGGTFAINFLDSATISENKQDAKFLYYFDLETGEETGSVVEMEKAFIGGAVLSPDGSLLASSDWDGAIHLLDAATGEEVGEALVGHDVEQAEVPRDNEVYDFDADNNYVQGLAFSPDNTVLASAGNDMTVRLWDLASGTQIGEPMLGHTHVVRIVTFSQDGSLLASGGENGRIILWDVETRQPIGDPIARPGWPLHDLVFSRDGSILISAWRDGAIILWDTATHRQIGLPIMDSSGRWLHVDLPQVDPLLGYAAHTTRVLDLALSPDGTELLSLDGNGKVRLWALDVDVWLERACTRAGRNMTQEEWDLYLPYETYRKTCPMYP